MALAAPQHWVISRRQLLLEGITVDAIRHQLRTKRWHRIHAGIYSVVPPSRLGRDGSFMAAVLACGDGAVLSHRAAVALWDLRPAPAGAIDVTTRRQRARDRHDIAIHRTRCLEPEDVTTKRRIPCTTVARTLLDLAGIFGERTLARSVEQSMVLGLFDYRELDAVLARSSGRRSTSIGLATG